MAWDVYTIEPTIVGENYKAFVNHPKDYVAVPDASGKLIATPSGTRAYEMPYMVRSGASEGVDIWDTGIRFTGHDPRSVDVKAMEGKKEKGKDSPEVADGTGGGAGSGTSYSAKVMKKMWMGWFRIVRVAKTST
ncbi:MAG: hypothetical protein H6595_02860 [Flavobacteriales bacterium]|nr:hypothetical protein [Flavobacteriales bacterium]MCB9166399.1 hypothetical protein [Flavobacteriales bacterium]